MPAGVVFTTPYFLSDIDQEIDRETRRVERLQMVVDRVNDFLDGHVAQWRNGLSFNDFVSLLSAS